MRCSRILACTAAAAWLLPWCADTGGQEVALKKRVAVLNFDGPSVGPGAPSGLFTANAEDVGKGVSAQLIQKLLPGGKYTVVDRYALEELLKEQKSANSEPADAYGLAAKIGRLLGLDAMILGAITRYGPDEKYTAAGSGLYHSAVHKRKSKAFVAITARVFNVSTGEAIAEFNGAGESAHAGEITTISSKGQPRPLEILSGDFLQSLLAEATSNAVDQIAAQLNLFADKIPALRIAGDGLVAEVAGNVLTLNVGEKSGIRVGDHLDVLRDSPAVADSATPKPPQPGVERVGTVTVTEVAADYATAVFSGPGRPQVGDHVRGVDNSRAVPH
jgi:curli biogenesis system outer membrane secretion channel CsgG